MEAKIKPILTLILFIIFTNNLINAQTVSKSENIYGRRGVHVSATIFETGDTIITWVAQNHKYQHIADMITLYSAEPTEFVEFIHVVIKFFEENDPDTSMSFDDFNITINTTLGTKYLDFYPELGYRRFTNRELNRILNSVQKWTGIN